MRFVKKHHSSIVWLLLFTVIYFLLRLYHLGSLPIFTDEAIYVRWGQIARQDASWRFISLTDGKQPMFIWVMIVVMKFFKDPLIAGRMVSVISGFFSMIGLYFLAGEVFKNRKIGLIAAFLCVFYPFALVYDRMALYDTMVGTFAIWSLFFLILMVRTLRLDVAMTLGLVAGGAVLTKTSGFFNIYLLPLTLLLLNLKKEHRISRVVKLSGLCLIVTVLTYLYYSILRLSPFYHIINEKNALFVFPLREWLKHPFTFFLGNLGGMWSWYLTYATIPIVFVTAFSFLVHPKDAKAKKIIFLWIIIWTIIWIVLEVVRSMIDISLLTFWVYGLMIVGSLILSWFFATRVVIKEKAFLVLWFFIPFVGLAFFGKVIYPRFIFFMTLALLPLTAYTFFHLQTFVKNKIVFIGIIILLVIQPIRSIYIILTNFAQSPIPYSDVTQYNNDWPGGLGVKEAITFFKQQSQNQKIFIATEGTFGLMPFSLEIYLKENPNIEIKGYWPIHATPPQEVINYAKQMPTYVVFYQPCPSCQRIGQAPPTWNVTQIYQVEKAVENRFFTLYQVNP